MAGLAALRRRRLLSQRELARQAGVASSSIYAIERGRTVPRLSVMRKIVAALDIADPAEVDEFRDLLGDGRVPEVEHGGALNEATDPVLADLRGNEEDSVYDELFAALQGESRSRAPA
jgi:transcriptional regulator with XRE-family HTH domain